MKNPFRFGLNVTSLSIMRGDTTVLRDIDLTIDPGSVIILRGANGAGKTTLLRAIAGLIPSDRHTITVTNKTQTIGRHAQSSPHSGHVSVSQRS